MGSSWIRDQTHVSCIGRRIPYHWATREAHRCSSYYYDLSASVQLLSCIRLFATPWTAAPQDSLSITNSQSLLKLMSIVSVMPPNHLILCHPLLLLPSIFPSVRVFSDESALHIRWPKYWSFSFNISSSNEYSGMISFRMDWLDLLAVQGPLESSPTTQFKSINSLHSAFFIVQLSYPCMICFIVTCNLVIK